MDLRKESLRITGNTGIDDKMNFFWGSNFSRIKETELGMWVNTR